MAKSRLQNRIDLLGPNEGKVARATLPSTGIPGVQANQQPIPGAPQKGNVLSDPRNALTLKTPDTSQYPYGDGTTTAINPGETIDPAVVAHSGLPGTAPLGLGKNKQPYGMQGHLPAEQLEMVAGNRPGEMNKATNPYLGLTGMPAPINGDMARMEGGTNQPANRLGFTGQPEPSGKTAKKLNAPKKKGGIA
tara:strand:+ start:2167 stop:2742 length:576 start_codon:yes stop_codon:yes gene_type:complete